MSDKPQNGSEIQTPPKDQDARSKPVRQDDKRRQVNTLKDKISE